MLTFDPHISALLLAAGWAPPVLILALLSRLVARHDRGTHLWLWAGAAGAIGTALISLQSRPAALWSVVVGNAALAAAAALILGSLNRFLEHPRPRQERLAVAAAAGVAAGAAQLSSIAPGAAWSAALTSGAVGFLHLLCAWSLAPAAPDALRASYRPAALIFGLGAVLQLLHAGLAAAGAVSPQAAQLLTALSGLAVLTLWAAAAVALVVQRLLGELQQARAAERAAQEQLARAADQSAAEVRELLDELELANRIVREREQIFRLTFDRSPIGTALLTLDGRFVRVNDALCAMSGFDEFELLRREALALLHPESRPMVQREVAALLGSGERAALETRAVRAEGTAVWLQLTVGAIRDDADRPFHLIALAEDITGRKRAEQRQALILRTVPDPFWFKDTAGRYVLWSDSFLAFHRLAAEQLAGKQAREVFEPALAASMEESDERVVATRAPLRRETAAADPHTAKLRWTENSKSLVYDDDGALLGIVGVARDITARKETEAALQRSSERLELALWGAELGLWDWHVPSGTIETNFQLARLIGLAPEALFPVVAVWNRNTHPEDLPVTTAAFEAAIEGRADQIDVVFRVRHADGGWRWQNARGRAVERDQAGRAVRLIGVTRDITAQKEAEDALREREALLRSLSDNLPQGYLYQLEYSAEGRPSYRYVSGGVASTAGITPEEVYADASLILDQLLPEDARRLAALTASVTCETRVFEFEGQARNPQGVLRWMYVRSTPECRDDGRIVFRGVALDITARKQAEEALRERELLLRSISDNLPNGMIYQLERLPDGTGRFRYISAGVERLWGVTPEAVYADPEALWSRIQPSDRPAFDQAARRACLSPDLFDMELRVVLPDGTQRWTNSRSSAQILEDGRLLRNGVDLDITARKCAEDQLRRRVHELTVLYQITHALTSWTNLAEGLVPVASLLREVFAAAPAIWGYDPIGRCLRPLLTAGPHPALRLADLAVPQALLERQTAAMVALGPESPLLGDAVEGEGAGRPRQTLLVPLRARQALVGLLCLVPADPERLYTPDDVALAQTVAGVLASALDNAHLFAHARTAAAEQERRRLARELHNSVSQALFAASRIAEMLPLLWELDPEEGREALGNLHRFTTGALAEMRALLVELRPPALVEAPLHETLAVLAPTAQSRGVEDVQVQLAAAPLLPPEVQVALYRVAQEALNNVIRHARARRVALALDVTPAYGTCGPWEGTAAISVVDDGRGFTPGPGAAEQFGLATMRERAAEIGASLTIDSAPGCGTRITVSWAGAAARPAEQGLDAP